MKNIPMSGRVLGSHSASLDVKTRLELVVRAALKGDDKDLALGVKMINGNNHSDIIWFEPRVKVSNIFKNKARPPKGSNSVSFMESLANPEEFPGQGGIEDVLEEVACRHFKKEIPFVTFEFYDNKVDVFVHYRKETLLSSVSMGGIDLFIESAECCKCVQLEDIDLVPTF